MTANSPKPHGVEWGLHSEVELASQSWDQWHVKDTHKGAKVVEVKSKIVYPKADNRLPLEDGLEVAGCVRGAASVVP